jgi:Lon protease-like protein
MELDENTLHFHRHDGRRMKIPLFPLDTVLFPGAPLPLHIFEDRYREMIRDCVAHDAAFGVVRAQREGLAVVGCTAIVVRVLHQYPDGRSDILTQGVDRFEIEQLDDSYSYLQAEVDLLPDTDDMASRYTREQCVALHSEALQLLGAVEPSLSLNLDEPISYLLAATLPSDPSFQQELLTIRSDAERTERLLTYYEAMLPKLRRGIQASQRAATNGHVIM